MAPIALPPGQSAFAELQIEPMVMIEQSAAAEIAKCQIDFVARRAADVVQWRPQRTRSVFHVHPEDQRRGVRQGRREGRRVWTIAWRELLRGCRAGPNERPGDANG